MNQPERIEPWKLVLIGLAAGVLGGGLGVGGGIILVPLLVFVGLDRHRAHATSLSAIVLIAIAGALSFGVSGEVDLVAGMTIGIGGIVGSVLGTTVMHRVSARSLTIVFGIVLLVAGIRLVLSAEPLPGAVDYSALGQTVIALGIGLVAGFFAGLAGIGGGVVIVPSSVLLLGLEQHEAQGTSLLAIVFTAIAGTIVNRRNQRVRLADGLLAGVGGVAGSLTGSRIALLIEARTLSAVFGILVLFVASRTLYRSLVIEG
ncbi:MAG TPA: sulfite exporter TauE/SafE family protein [Acidimicrobiia bacterium]|nr:sulfite exporter TauE/SafE family protein [Acidimicrobiia bacterium]